jgi:hypothetical protein
VAIWCEASVLLMAIATTAPYAATPISNLVNGRIEASADVYALQATDNVPAFIRMQHDLATSNLTRLDSSWGRPSCSRPIPTRFGALPRQARCPGSESLSQP